MHNSYNIGDLVKTAQKDAPLPSSFGDLDEASQRRLRREAEAQGITPEALYAAILAQTEKDAGETFDADAIARAARR
ncbi:hypothetical protein AB4Y72_16360 [Arthrobacter sp. YAF34]|uniref:hypothetical protein n=1 Tax=Arthrobacter sp. YAF34 TaxID=3233083 RepID=UPI003F8DF77E